MNQQVVYTGLGGPEVVGVTSNPLLSPEPGQVRVQMEAAGAAYGDVLPRRGLSVPAAKFPYVPGYDVVGRIDALGQGVTTVAVGDRVAALPGTGGQQQFICLEVKELVAVPDGVSSEHAAAVTLNYLTAYQLLVRAAELTAGQSAFIYGLTGGLGSAMRDIGRQLGIEVSGTASGGRLEALKGENVIAFRRDDPKLAQTVRSARPKGFDAVFDPIGGPSLGRSYKLLGSGGTLVMLGAASAVQSGGNIPLGLIGTMSRLLWLKMKPGRRVLIYVVLDFKKKHPDLFREDLARLFDWLKTGKINPQIAEVTPLSEAARVQDLLERSAVSGKIVFRP